MKRVLVLGAVLAVAISLLATVPAGAGSEPAASPIAVDISDRLKNVPAPPQLSPTESAAVVAAGATTTPQCDGDGETLTITLTSWDPANPGSQDVVFFKETPSGSTGKATLWVAWDFLTTAYGRADVITCDQLTMLQGSLDEIVDTDTKYFGDYVQRPAGNPNIDVMIYNIVDESYFDPTFPFYIAGFFWGGVNEAFDRNMIFVDTYDWANRLGPDVLHPFLYEGTVAHELEHLIHNDHDGDEMSWIDEGMADLAEFLNGFGHPDSHVVYYLAFHRTSLTQWGGGLESYGASYLFQLYLLENFGHKDSGAWDPGWTRTLIDEQANSIAGVELATGKTFGPIYDAWILANYLDKPGLESAAGYPLGYDEIDLVPFTSRAYSPWSIARSISDIYGASSHGNLPVSRYYGGYVSTTVEYPKGGLPPYAPLYRTFGGMTPSMAINVRGDAVSGVDPQTGTGEVWGGASNMLTDRMLELNVPVGGTLTFWTWFDIEEEWDYGFVEASIDDGATWVPVPGNITRTSANPNNSTAWANSLVSGQSSTDAAITGSSGGWVQGTFVLPAASDVLVRFSYYTDESTLGKGWFIDDVAVDGFGDGFESGTDDWTLGGWALTTGRFPNNWVAEYVVPVFISGRFASLNIGSIEGAPDGDYERIAGVVDTSRINRDAPTVVISNRPGESPFDAGYVMLVKKK